MDVIGAALVLLMYFLVFLVGLFAFRRAKKQTVMGGGTELILANRDLGMLIGIGSLVATEVGGAFVNGSAEEAYLKGLLWCIAPVGYSLSMTLNALFFVPKIRSSPKGPYLTLIDCLQEAYGQVVGALVYFPSCIGDICWTAAVLSALGGSLEVLLDISRTYTIVVSATIAMTYTLLGGMYAVAYTDAIQFGLIFMGLFMALPFVATSERQSVLSIPLEAWTGAVSQQDWPSYVDQWLLVLLGGIPWQPYYQRVLSVKTTQKAVTMSVIATCLSLMCLIPSVIIGVSAKTWNQEDSALITQSSLVLPIVISFTTPVWVSYIAIASLSAAVMSSIDSSILSGASYLTHNVLGTLYPRPNGELSRTGFRASVILLTILATILSISTDTVYGLWILAGDLGYIVVFPLFLCAVHGPQWVNTTGAVGSSLLGLGARILLGEPILGWAGFFPGVSRWPIKTANMLLTLITLWLFSGLARLVASFRTSVDGEVMRDAREAVS